MEPRITTVGARRSFRRGDEDVHALRGIDLELHAGQLVALTGPSGSGKSTLLLVLAGWETLDHGTVTIADGSARAHPAELQWGALAVIPQALGLMDDLTVTENVTLPARLSGGGLREDLEDLLDLLDISRLRSARADELSLGERQRVAVARALALRPAIVLADEPSTHQDADHGRAVFEALRFAADAGAAVVVASHDPSALGHADRVITMSDGLVANGP